MLITKEAKKIRYGRLNVRQDEKTNIDTSSNQSIKIIWNPLQRNVTEK